MPPEVDLPLESSLADAAGERFVAAVLAHVRDQVRRLAERLPAHDALVRFLAWNNVLRSCFCEISLKSHLVLL